MCAVSVPADSHLLGTESCPFSSSVPTLGGAQTFGICLYAKSGGQAVHGGKVCTCPRGFFIHTRTALNKQ